MLVDGNHVGEITQWLMLYGLGSHTVLLTAPRLRSRADLGAVVVFGERRLSLAPQPHPAGTGMLGCVFCSFPTTGGCPPPQAGRGGGEEFAQYSIYPQCLMGVRVGANCAGSSDAHTDWWRVFLPRWFGIVAPPEPFWELVLQTHRWECTEQSVTQNW